MQKFDQTSWHEFIQLCRHAKSESLFEELLDLFFTFEEKQHIATRIKLVTELLKGEKPQRQISKELEISIAKITRGSNALKQISEQLRGYLNDELGA